jgi:hypothetical protein
MLVSFAIPTRAQSCKLLALLGDFSKQLAGVSDAEVVVLVNGATDWGSLTGSTYLSPGFPGIRLEIVTDEGEACARFLLAKKSRAAYVWFLDDDVRLGDEFVKKALSFLRDAQPDYGGGAIYLHPDIHLPDWAKSPEILHWLTVHDGIDPSRLFYPVGANCFVKRKELLELEPIVKASPYTLGRKGNFLFAGMEIDLWYRLNRLGRKKTMCPDILVYHDIHLERLSEAWFLNRVKWESISYYCRFRNYGLAPFLVELARRTPGIVSNTLRYLFRPRSDNRRSFVLTLHFRELTAFIPYLPKILLKRPIGR